MNNTNTNQKFFYLGESIPLITIVIAEKRQCLYAAPKKMKIQKNTDCVLE